MRTLSALIFTMVATLASSTSAQYIPGGCVASHYDLQRNWELATYEQRLHQTVDFPILVRRLRTDIQIAEERICMLRQRLLEYEPYNRFRRGGGALTLTIQETRLALLREEQHLRELRLRLAEEQRMYRNHQWALMLETLRKADELARKNASLADQGTIKIVTYEEVMVPEEEVE